MAQRTPEDKGDLFIKRAKQFNLAFIVSITVLFLINVLLYKFFSLPVSSKLVLYVYTLQIFTGLLAYVISLFIRKKMFPVRVSEEYWSYTAVRRYFWSYVLICIPFGIGFLFYIFAGNLSVLTLGYLISLFGLILFKPREGDVI